MAATPSSRLITALQNPGLYDHPVQHFKVVETHISWVLLTGPYAYKIKKPVNLGFLDFTTLEQRRHYCAEEVRLNRRMAPDTYLDVIKITGSATQPRLGAEGPALEYAVRMREFPQQAQLDRALASGAVQLSHWDNFAARLATFHSECAVAAADSVYGSAEAVWTPQAENFLQIEPHLDDPVDVARLAQLHEWSEKHHQQLQATLAARRRDGWIRECHGDLHLANLALVDDEVIAFDGIEFNANLRWIDVMSDVAFLTMDLYNHNRPALAHRFLNLYLQHSGDYAGVAVLRFYQVYRALVRAKVACLRLAQTSGEASKVDTRQRAALQQQCRDYLQLAQRCARGVPTPLIITHGVSGSGKTVLTDSLLETSGAVRVRSDVERKRLFGMSANTRSGSSVMNGLYTPEATENTYQELARLARLVITGSYPVIVDATFLKRDQRRHFRALAENLKVPFVILDCHAPAAVLRQRITQRQREQNDASEASVRVLEHQLAEQEPLLPEEAARVLSIRTASSP